MDLQPSSMLLLPASVFELVLQHLPLAQQLDECCHLSRRLPPLSSSSIRYAAPLLLTDDSVLHLLHSPRLLALFSGATSVALRVNTRLTTSRACQFLLSPPNGQLLFPQLASFSFRLSSAAVKDEDQRHHALMRTHRARGVLPEQKSQLSILPLLPFLSARHGTLRSLHIVHPGSALGAQLSALLAPLTSLHALYVASQLSVAHVMSLLPLPLDVLDLSLSELMFVHPVPGQLSAAIVSETAFTLPCRVLRLPQPGLTMNLLPLLCASLDQLLTRRASSGLPHTLAVQHRLTAAVVDSLIDSPPSRCLDVVVSMLGLQPEPFLARAASLEAFVAAPRQLRLSVVSDYWTDRATMQPFIDCVRRHQRRIRSVALTKLPLTQQAVDEVLAAVTQCAQLETLRLSTAADRARWPPDTQPAQSKEDLPQLLHLRSLTLTGMRGIRGSMLRLVSACPSLQVCVLDLLDVSDTVLRTLAASCPLLSHLRLHVTDESALATSPVTIGTAGEQAQTAAAFRSLLTLELYYTAWSNTRPQQFVAVVNGLQRYLHGSPLRRLRLLLRYDITYQRALTPLLSMLPELRKLKVANATFEPLVAPFTPTTGWDREADDGMDDGSTESKTGAAPFPSALLAQPAAAPRFAAVPTPALASLDSLDLLVSAATGSFDDLALLLAHCPHTTAIKLTVQLPAAPLLTFLRCLALVGRHCPLLERVTFALDLFGPAAGVDVRVLGVEEVRPIVDQYELSRECFGRLRYVVEVGAAMEVMSQEAAEYVRRSWMGSIPGAVVLDWHTAPIVA